MKIKDRLSLFFTITSTLILLVALTAIFITFKSFVKADFYSRLFDRAKVAAQLYLEADEISPDSLTHVRERYLKKLPGEVMRFYDERNAASFIKDKQQYWSNAVINAVRKNKQVELNEGSQQTVGVYYNDNQGNFVILVSAMDTQGHRRLDDLVEIMLIFLLSVVAGLFIAGQWFAKKALEPIDKIVDEMQLVRASNLSHRINEGNGRDEISKLAQNFNGLLKHLENAFELQQTFVTNASHELRTPVTSIIGEIEVALNRPRSPKDYENLLQSILAEAGRLNETITGLLELAQVDMSYTQAALSPVAIDELVWELSDSWTKKMGKDLFTVSILKLPDDPEQLIIAANKSLLIIALNNIIGNAYKFSGNQRVKCTLYADEKRISIAITDSGIGILPEELEKVFHSFYRGANVKDYHGNGIGLYVTNKIINLFNGFISINSEPVGGTEITIHFIR